MLSDVVWNSVWSHFYILNMITSAKTTSPNNVTITCSRGEDTEISFVRLPFSPPCTYAWKFPAATHFPLSPQFFWRPCFPPKAQFLTTLSLNKTEPQSYSPTSTKWEHFLHTAEQGIMGRKWEEQLQHTFNLFTRDVIWFSYQH